MTAKKKEEFIDNILKRQLNIAACFGRFVHWPVDETVYVIQKNIITNYIRNLNIGKIKQRLTGKKTG